MRIIIPNYHIILIHFPLALLGIGLFAEVFSFLWRRSSFRQAGRWMILLGTLLLLPAATSGIFALADVAGRGQSADSWEDLKAGNGFQEIDWTLARNHIVLNSFGAVLALIAVVGWIGASDRWRSRLYFPGLLLLLIAMALLTSGAWHGGEMIFREGFGVSGRLGVLPEHLNPPTDLKTRIDEGISPMQIHLIFAGLVFAAAAAALGLSLRRSWTVDDLLVQRLPLEDAATQLSLPPALGNTDAPTLSIRPLLDDPGNATVVSAVAPRVPSARFWIVAALLALITITLGFYVGEYLQRDFKDRLHDAIAGIGKSEGRQGMHIIFGSTILLLTLVLGIIARWSPRKRLPLGLISGLLIVVMAGQVWFGILLLYDGGSGPWTHFKRPVIWELNGPPLPAATQPGGNVS
jgi:uncharacterized membrane protein